MAWQVGAGRSALQAPQELLQLLQQGAGAQAAPRPPIQPEGQEGAGPHSFTCGVRQAAKHPSADYLGARCQRFRVLAPGSLAPNDTFATISMLHMCLLWGYDTLLLHSRQSWLTSVNP